MARFTDDDEFDAPAPRSKCKSCTGGAWIAVGVLALIVVIGGAFVIGRASVQTAAERKAAEKEALREEMRRQGQSGQDFIEGFSNQARETSDPKFLAEFRESINKNNNDNRR